MRFVTFDSGSGPQAGQLSDRGIAPLSAPGQGGLGGLLRAGPLPTTDTVASLSLEDVRLLPPITDPAKIVCIGLNYHAHAAEQGAEAPETPTIFAKYPNALAAHDTQVMLPPFSRRVDYEAEVAFVVADRCKDVAESDALAHIAGYTLFNDLSARDYQFKTPQWMPGKIFDGAAPCGPALVTPDEAGAHDAIEISLDLNGEEMQSGTTADLVHSIPALLAYLSELMTLEPGDVVSTGTPAGVGSLREPKVWLKAGDHVVVKSPQLGLLSTRLA